QSSRLATEWRTGSHQHGCPGLATAALSHFAAGYRRFRAQPCRKGRSQGKGAAVKLDISADDLRPLVSSVIAEMMDRFGEDQGRLAFSEAEAAKMLGIRSHVLRDARLRGEIVGSKLGRGYSYTRAALLAFLEQRRAEE